MSHDHSDAGAVGAAAPADAARARLGELLGYHTTQMLYVAARLGLADELAAGPRTAEALAARVGAHPGALSRLLRALASLGVFAADEEERFRLTPMAELLQADAPGSMRPLVLSYGEPWWWNAWGHLLHAVRTGEVAFHAAHGQGAFEYFRRNPEAGDVFQGNMTAMTTEEARAVLEAYDFSTARVLVDVGGGHGALAGAILAAHPRARALLLDLPEVVEAGRRRVAAAGLAGRVEFVPGSFFDSVPRGGDTYLLKDILHDWDDGRAAAILGRCREALSPTSKLLVIERLVPPGNERSAAKIIDIAMLVMTGGMERTEAEYRALFAAAGLGLELVLPTSAGPSVMVVLPA